MKLRGSNEKINPLTSLYVILGLVAVAVPFRMYQLLNIIESDTGFYKRVDWSVYLIYGLAVLAVIVPFVLTNLAKNVPESKAPFRKNRFLAATSIVFAIGLLADAVICLSNILLSGGSIAMLIVEGGLIGAVEGVFAIFAAIYMFIFGISYVDGRTTYSQYKFLALSPLFWSMCRIVIRFVRKISYINVSDLMLELFAIAFMMIFFLHLARISSGLSNDKAMRNLFVTGFVSIFFTVTTNLPRLVMVITGNGRKLPDEYPFALCDLAFAFFAFAYIVNAMKYAELNDSNELAFEIYEEAVEENNDEQEEISE